MIGHLNGTVIYTEEKYIILDVSGVGYKVFVTNSTRSNIRTGQEEVSLWTYLVVKEDALDLYGFENIEDVDLFKLLISVSGVGPKSGLGVLNIAPVKTLVSAISSGDVSYLTKVSGIGKKSAQKIILDLKDKLGAIGGDDSLLQREDLDIIEALESMGYGAKDAREALSDIPTEITGTSQKITEALKLLGKKD